ncbi:MAG TPA: CFI-box-CTERM domain-containing protein [Kofleriaceae bacterium]|nr:CFI-box-CTERM domain-containing protein [Kofleriaceae bacterium]
MRPIVRWLALAAVAVTPGSAAAEGDCRLVQVEMLPTPDLQIVAWLEDGAGNYVDTIYITRMTGSFGMGNRPGMMEFNSGPRWPYGRRITTFPVWAHRHGMEWPELRFQNDDDMNLSHPLGDSSVEQLYCRPIRENEALWDAETCATTAYTDKGIMSPTGTSLYPPRDDLQMVAGVDNPDVQQFDDLNPFDAVSRATPPGNDPYRINWPIPTDLPLGDYVLWVEVSKEFDQNASYDYPEPTGIPWQDYGIPYRGQPSVVWRVPFTLSAGEEIAMTAEYAGYGDPDGLTGMLFEPDPTITTDVPGSGADRLLLVDDGTDMYRLKLTARPTFDESDPGAVDSFTASAVYADHAELAFFAAGDDGDVGTVTGYDVRIQAGEAMTEASFADASPAGAPITPDDAGMPQELTVGDLLPETNYYVGIRAYDECNNVGPLAILHFQTPAREGGEVDACFIATAAYGSMLADEVHMLRGFRDGVLRTSVTGELITEGYYTFGPALAQLIKPSDTARRAARAGLFPLVEAVKKVVARRPTGR